MDKLFAHTANKSKELTSSINMMSNSHHSRFYITLPWSAVKPNSTCQKTRKEYLDSNTWMPLSWETHLKLHLSNSISQLKKSPKQEAFILMESQKTENLKCLSTLLTSMLCQSFKTKALIITLSSILKEPQKKYGSSAPRHCMKDAISQLMLKKRRSLKLST